MYTSTSYSAYPARTAWSTDEVSRNQEETGHPYSPPQLVYSRNPSENIPVPREQLGVDIPEKGRREIVECENALLRFVRYPYGSGSKESKIRPMVAYLQKLIHYGQAENFNDLHSRLNFLDGVRGFGILNQRIAINRAQNLFHYGMADKKKAKDFSDSLQLYVGTCDADVIRSMRKFNPNDFLNADTIGAICKAAKLFGEAGGDVAQLRFDTDPTGALAVLAKYLPDDRARYAAEIMMTKPVGYKSCITDGRVNVLCEPAPQTPVQIPHAFEPQVPLLQPPVRKRSLDLEAPPEQVEAVSPSDISKRVRSDNLSLPGGDRAMAMSLAPAPVLPGNDLLAGPVRSDSPPYLPDNGPSGHRNDDEESIRVSSPDVSQGFQQTAVGAPSQTRSGEAGAPFDAGDLDDLLKRFPYDPFPGAFWADRVVASLQNNDIVDDRTQRTPTPDPADSAS